LTLQNRFSVYGINAEGMAIMRRPLKRRYVLPFWQKQPCLVDIEACASSHYWSRELQAFGHSALMPAAYVNPYVKARHGTKHRPWLTRLLAQRATKVAAVALANKMARMAWAMMGAMTNPSHSWRERDGSGIQCDVKVAKGEQDVTHSRSIRRSGQPTRAIALSNAGF
jgi:hypothetical protein